jgi:cyclophilin family peptidyl-prolyl cis-trans isomerase
MNLSRFVLFGAAASALLAGCGGGGGDPGGPPPVVTLSSTSSVKYGETMLVTLSGSHLDQTLTLTSAGCRDFARSITAPNISTATTAYYTCKVSGVGQLSLTVAAGGLTAATVPFTVAVPQVSMAISNGVGVTGTLVITLAPDLAPLTVDNFLAYVKSGFYNGTVFHRHAKFAQGGDFVLQGGGYAGPLAAGGAIPTPKTTAAPIVLEDGAGASNLRWSVAMARTSAFDSATSQFFINLVDNSLVLDRTSAARGYAVFGTVSAGTAVVTAMTAAPCSLWPAFFDPPPPNPASLDCLPVPNLAVTGAIQTQ